MCLKKNKTKQNTKNPPKPKNPGGIWQVLTHFYKQLTTICHSEHSHHTSMLCLNSSADRGEICRSQFPRPDAQILQLTMWDSVRCWVLSPHSTKHIFLPLHRELSTSQDWEVCSAMIFFGECSWWICLFNDYHFHVWPLFSWASLH